MLLINVSFLQMLTLQGVVPAIRSLCSTCAATRKEQYEALMQIK